MKLSIPIILFLAIFLALAFIIYFNQAPKAGNEVLKYRSFSSPDEFKEYVSRSGYIYPGYYVERGIPVPLGLPSVTTPGFEKGAEADR